jgi:[protein-PII] uridylyltransferase
LRELSHPTKVKLTPTGDNETTTLTIIANDRPGLLAVIGKMFIDLSLHVRSARIATLGERVEDTFLIQNQDGQPIAIGEATYTLQETMRQRLDTALRA